MDTIALILSIIGSINWGLIGLFKFDLVAWIFGGQTAVLSRIIYAESGNQSLKGKMAVGNVIMNRVKSKKFPNSIVGVLSQKNQFSTYQGGALANRKPNQSSVIAAKLVLDGGVVAETRGALYFDSLVNSWSSRNRTYLCKLGDHNFYR